MHLHSANSSQSYIPQQILDQKAEELKKRKEISDQINVSAPSPPPALLIMIPIV